MALRTDDLRRLIARRSVDWTQLPGEKGHLLALQVEFERALPHTILDRLLREGQQAAHVPVAGAVSPRWVEVTPERVTLYLEPVHTGALRLDQVIAAAPGGALSPALAGTIVATVAHVLHALHLAPGIDGEARVHGELHAGSVLLTPVGSVALIGPGLPLLHAMLLPDRSREADRFRGLSPEAARGEPLTPSSDAYSLAVLYYQLVTGQPYRGGDTATAICTKAIEGAQPDLPGLLPPARRGLHALLAHALAPEREARPSSLIELAGQIGAELSAAGLSYSSAADVSALVASVPLVGLSTGPAAFVAPEALSKDQPFGPRPSERPQAIGIVEAHALARPAPAPPPAPAPVSAPPPLTTATLTPPQRATSDPWAAVFGEDDATERVEAVQKRAEPISSPGLAKPSAPAPAPATPPGPVSATASAPAPLTLPKPKGPTSGSRPAISAETSPAIASALGDMVEQAVQPRTGRAKQPEAKRSLGSYAGYAIALVLLLVAGGVWLVGRGGSASKSTAKTSVKPNLVADREPSDAGTENTAPPPVIPPPPPPMLAEGPDGGVSRSRRGSRRYVPPPPPPPPAVPEAAATGSLPGATGSSGRAPAVDPNGEKSPLGLLSVNSKPSGASVELDGGYVGTTPLVMRATFAQRSYTVRVLADGHAVWEKALTPDPTAKTITVMAILEKSVKDDRRRRR